MDNNDPKIQISKTEIVHDLNNLNYLLRTLAKVIDGMAELPPDIKRLSAGAVSTTDRLIAKLGGAPRSAENLVKEPSNNHGSADEGLNR